MVFVSRRDIPGRGSGALTDDPTNISGDCYRRDGGGERPHPNHQRRSSAYTNAHRPVAACSHSDVARARRLGIRYRNRLGLSLHGASQRQKSRSKLPVSEFSETRITKMISLAHGFSARALVRTGASIPGSQNFFASEMMPSQCRHPRRSALFERPDRRGWALIGGCWRQSRPKSSGDPSRRRV